MSNEVQAKIHDEEAPATNAAESETDDDMPVRVSLIQ